MYSMILYLVRCESLYHIPVFPPLTGCDRLVSRAKVIENAGFYKKAQLVDTDIESDSEEAPLEAEESQPLGSRVPLISEEFKAFEPSGTRTDSSHSSASSYFTTPLSPDHLLTYFSPTPTPTRASFHRRTARMTVFSIWKAFGGNTRDLGSFEEETDKTTDLHQHFSRLCSQRLETASQDARDVVTIHPMTVSQESMTTSARTTQPKI
ncbi:hypothetical protein Tco_0242854 [Tanacetum coccineum]